MAKALRLDIRGDLLYRLTASPSFLLPWNNRDLTALTERPMRRAVSRVVNSSSSRKRMAARIPGFNWPIAANKIRTPSRCKYLASGPGLGSGISKADAVPSSLPESSMDTSRITRPLRSNMRASLMAIRVSQVEKEDFPSNLCKWKALAKVCWTTSSASAWTRV